ncbi:unnamed protein product, partial [Nesidiocoris tenuis]
MNPSSKNSHPPSGLPPPPYPEVTLHPVGGGGRIPSPPVSTSLLHGILTKNVPTSRPSNFSPTLARLLTAPDRPPAAAHQSMVVHPPPPPYRPQQQSSSSRVPTISDIINSSKKSRNEITITPVPGNQPPQKIPKEEAPTVRLMGGAANLGLPPEPGKAGVYWQPGPRLADPWTI